MPPSASSGLLGAFDDDSRSLLDAALCAHSIKCRHRDHYPQQLNTRVRPMMLSVVFRVHFHSVVFLGTIFFFLNVAFSIVGPLFRPRAEGSGYF